jgi:hypothetical protein
MKIPCAKARVALHEDSLFTLDKRMFVSIPKSISLVKMEPLFGAQPPTPLPHFSGKTVPFTPSLLELPLNPIIFEFT